MVVEFLSTILALSVAVGIDCRRHYLRSRPESPSDILNQNNNLIVEQYPHEIIKNGFREVTPIANVPPVTVSQDGQSIVPAYAPKPSQDGLPTQLPTTGATLPTTLIYPLNPLSENPIEIQLIKDALVVAINKGHGKYKCVTLVFGLYKTTENGTQKASNGTRPWIKACWWYEQVFNEIQA
jgi:hypothetical protein